MLYLKFEWLKDYQDLEEHLLYLKWNLNKSKLELDRWVNGDLAKIKLTKDSRASSLEEKIQIIEKEIEIVERQLEETKAFLDQFTSLENQILKLKYIDNLTLEAVAEELGYSYQYIKSKHASLRRIISYLNNHDEKEAKKSQRQGEIEQSQKKLDRKETQANADTR